MVQLVYTKGLNSNCIHLGECLTNVQLFSFQLTYDFVIFLFINVFTFEPEVGYSLSKQDGGSSSGKKDHGVLLRKWAGRSFLEIVTATPSTPPKRVRKNEDDFAYVYIDYETVHFTGDKDLQKIRSDLLFIVNLDIGEGDRPYELREVNIYMLEQDATDEFLAALTFQEVSK